MLKVTVLLPTCYNDCHPIPLEDIQTQLRKLRPISGGFTREGGCEGEYVMDNGYLAIDQTLKIWVVVDSSKLNELREWAADCARVFEQESIYFEHKETCVDFVRG